MTSIKTFFVFIMAAMAFNLAYAKNQIGQAAYEDTYYESVVIRPLASNESLDKGTLVFKDCNIGDCVPVDFKYVETTVVELPDGTLTTPKSLLNYSGKQADVAVNKKSKIIRKISLY